MLREDTPTVSLRAVARQAGVSLGLVNYHYSDKTSLLRAVLLRVEEQDLAMLSVDPGSPVQQLRAALRRVADPTYLTTEYLSLRLQLWALARADAEFEQINADAQKTYRGRLTELIAAARPDLSRDECRRRAADIDVLQNGMWLTVLLGWTRGRSLGICAGARRWRSDECHQTPSHSRHTGHAATCRRALFDVPQPPL